MVLAQTHGTSLQHQTTSQFGVFRCQADNGSNSSLVLERGKNMTLTPHNYLWYDTSSSIYCATLLFLSLLLVYFIFGEAGVDNLIYH